MTIPAAKYDIYEADLDSLIVEVANQPHPHALRGLGYGSRDCQQKHTAMDPSWKGVWVEETIEIADGFNVFSTDTDLGILIPLTASAYAEKQIDMRYRAVGALDIAPNPGEYINLYTLDAPNIAKFLQIQNVEVSPSGKLTLDLGKRKQDEIDAFNAKKDLSNAYLEAYLEESANSISNSGTLTVGDDDNGWGSGWNSGSFTIPAQVADAANNHRVTADLSVKLASGVSIGEAILYFTCNGYAGPFSYFNHYLLNDSISGIDITNMVNYGSATSLVVWCRLRGAWIGGLPTANVSMAIHAWRRIKRA